VSADAKTSLSDHEEDEARHADSVTGEHHEAHPEEHEHHDGHEREVEEDHQHEEAHADIDATWRFSCEQPDMLDRISVRLFDVFPRTQRLQVQYITEKQQGAASLNAAQPELRF
jgi:ABC-type Zn2+ transport system substrate-binding protein/surface adhesin